MKSSRFLYTPMFLLLLCGLILGLSLAKPDDVSHAEWIGVTSSPNVEQCSLIQEKGEISFIIQKNGSWQGLQVTKQATPLKKQEIEFNGNSLAELGKFLNESPCGISHFSGTMVLELRGHVRAGETFDLTLPSQSGTGYLWEVEDLDQNGVILIGQPQMRQVSPHIGGIAAQIIPFRALLSNEVTLRLRYHRPWEVDNPVDFTFLIQGDQISLAELAQHISYSIPNTILENPNIGQATSVQGTPTPEQIIVMQDLPAAFNWCALGKCTPVRDQRNCGSCWAFATTGVLESKLLIAEKGSQDLSEQYLLSCNTNGWDCQGGWFAHDYHIWKTPPSETEAGAVLESAFPYQATMVPCNGPYAHPYRALSWSYVNRYVEIPSVAEIKQAIYTYGPVAAAVCAGPAFSSYRSGIFSTDEKSSCGSNMVDHGVVLVGWDDAQGVWILRNSWGPYWGEGGYMRIKYGISNVGFGANYLVYNTSPSPTTPAPTTPPSTTPPSTTPAPTTPPPTQTSKLFLPIILRLTNNISLLPNGNFEQGRVIWQESSQKGYAILYNISQTSNAAPPHSGNWAAWLGGALGEISSIQQSVTIPPEKPILSYWHWIASEDSCGYDFGGVLVNNSVIDMYALCDDQDTHGWTLHAVDLSAYKGQTVFLEIRAETDDLYNSNLFIDDVGFQTSLAAQFEVGTQKSQRINPTKADWNIQSLTMVTPVPPIRLFSPSYFVPRMRQ